MAAGRSLSGPGVQLVVECILNQSTIEFHHLIAAAAELSVVTQLLGEIREGHTGKDTSIKGTSVHEHVQFSAECCSPNIVGIIVSIENALASSSEIGPEII